MPGPARVVLGVALLILVLTILNAALASAISPELQRAEVLSGLAAVGLMLVSVLWTRANPRSAERRELKGEQGLQLAENLDALQRQELAWGSHMLLTATPAATVLVQWKGQIVLRRGLLGTGEFEPGPISRRVLDQQKLISLVNTGLFPGRVEFDPVLPDLPSVIVCPAGSMGLVIIGGWSERCFSRSDELWLQGWSERLRTTLEADPASSRLNSPPA